jgi:hypothetical protein
VLSKRTGHRHEAIPDEPLAVPVRAMAERSGDGEAADVAGGRHEPPGVVRAREPARSVPVFIEHAAVPQVRDHGAIDRVPRQRDLRRGAPAKELHAQRVGRDEAPDDHHRPDPRLDPESLPHVGDSRLIGVARRLEAAHLAGAGLGARRLPGLPSDP